MSAPPSAAARKIVIAGAGLAGALQAIFLRKLGYDVELFENRSDMRKESMSAGRSINLALSARGLHALDRVGLKDDIMSIAIPMYARAIHLPNGEVVKSPYSKDGTSHINSVSRGELNKRLMTRCEEAGAKIHFQHKCSNVNLRTKRCTFASTTDGTTVECAPTLLVGADGAFSAVRNAMQKTDRFDYSQAFLPHGYKELCIPALADGQFALDKNCLHIWPRGTLMMIALPNLDGSFTCTLFAPFEPQAGADPLACFAAMQTREEVSAYFTRVFTDAVPLMPTLLDDFFNNPTSSLCTVRCRPWSRANFAVLIGDAAHAVVPFFGQGMNCAFEDCAALHDCLRNSVVGGDVDLTNALQQYDRLRIDNANAIADMALENFVEMRDKTADKNFLFRKDVQRLLGNTFPGRFLDRYERVSFSIAPYTEAVRIGKLNDRVVDELLAPLNGQLDIKLIDLKLAEQLIDKYLSE